MQPISRPPSKGAPAHIKPLSVLPMFLDLTGKRAVVAGGSEAAAWKAELLAASGAEVNVYVRAGEVSEGLANIVAREPAVTLHARVWDAACLQGAAVALADAEDDAEGAAFEAAARRVGALCNVIDKPAYCHFQFGSIVNRSPVVVGISTSGAAPILAQAVRRRVETLLPPSLAKWAALASSLRDSVIARRAPGAGRRAFWERLADRAFGPPPDRQAEDELRANIDAVAERDGRGHVTFVGAGPGDAELLTLKAVRALQAADVILFDDLVSDDVLELARREARRILVGKRAGRSSCKQQEINDRMVKLARAGRRVVRLKSGDPMIFGRTGEEIAVLEAAGIGYDVVPGITAGVALAAALGISLTHRDRAKSVRFVTGHSKAGGLPEDVDWRAIADPSATTIFYMAGRTGGDIAKRLLEKGLSPHTPVVIAAAIGRPAEQLRTTDLTSLRRAMADIDATMPILIGVGEAFRFCLRQRRLTIGVTLALFALSIVGMGFVQQQFFLSSDRNELIVDWNLPHNSSIAETGAQMARFEKEALGGDVDITHWSSYVDRVRCASCLRSMCSRHIPPSDKRLSSRKISKLATASRPSSRPI